MTALKKNCYAIELKGISKRFGPVLANDSIDLGLTVDERIADGFYFARSLRLVKHIFANPEMLDKPIGEESGFTY